MTNEGYEPGETTANKRRRFAFSGIEQRLLKRLKGLGLGPCPTIVVGFSGGPDSLCLAAILARLAKKGHVEPHLVHVNHRLRPNSEQESAAVDALAHHLGLPITRRNLRVDFVDDHPGAGVEEAARRERYLQLAGEAESLGARVIAIAHHRNDQAETVLLHLLRGSGLTGVSGMKEVSKVAIPWWSGETGSPEFAIWRPLLIESKEEIDRLVASLGVVPITDESNIDQRFRRNAIRHSVLPAIDAVYPEARAAIARFALIAGEEDQLLDQLAQKSLIRIQCGEESISVAALLAESKAIQRRAVALWLEKWVSSEAISFERIEAVLTLAANHRGGKEIEVGEMVSVTLTNGELVVRTLTGIGELAD